MTEPRKSQHRPKAHPENAYYGEKAHHGTARAQRRAGELAAGATAYREEFERNYGPDLDEPLDGTESGHES
jgi:hypothetical protein